MVSFLIPLVLLLFGVLNDEQTAASVLLLAGAWTATYGLAFASSKDRMYDLGFGVIVALLSTFAFLQLQYVLGLVVLSILGLVVASIVMGRNKP